MEVKFFVAEVIEFIDGTKDAPAIYTKASEEEAMALYHKDMGTWMGKENVSCVTISVFSNNDRMLVYDCHRRKGVVSAE